MPAATLDRRRWVAFTVLCLGIAMIVLDASVVTVAIPFIRADLGFSQSSLVWLVNAYMLTFGGFQLLGGRLGDLYGARRLFLFGVVGFTVASVACGLSTSQRWLIGARAAQGLAAAVVDAVGFALGINLFKETSDRATAMGIYAFVACASGSIGVVLGGVVTTSLSWHWIFLINLPLGLIVYAACSWLIPTPEPGGFTTKDDNEPQLDVLGAVLATTSLVLAVYAVINGNDVGWASKQTVGTLGIAAASMFAFLFVESRIKSPLVPLELFRSRAVSIANLAAVLWTAAMFAWNFTCTLYLQRVLGMSAMQVASAFVPANVITAVLALSFSARIVKRFGIKTAFAAGVLLGACGLMLFATAPVKGDLLIDVLPGMTLLGVASGIAFNPMLLAAMSGVQAKDSGVAAGLVGTSSMMGGALGLAIVVSAAEARTHELSISGVELLVALNGGYHCAFAIGAAFAASAAVLAVLLLPSDAADMSQSPAERETLV